MNQLGDVFTQCVRGLNERLRHNRVITPSVQHSDRLGALTGKYKSKLFHE
jgi:hypothetical protein